MVVRSNIMGINANRQLGMNNNQVSKNLEKLASGFRINRAGDDASGLAISEQMKAQIKSLDVASANAQDAISVIQTAEGALTETHDILNRMTELAMKSANGVLNEKARANLQEETAALIEEIDRIASKTNFSGTVLLDGNLSMKLQIGDTADQVVELEIGKMDAEGIGVKDVDISADADAGNGAIATIKDAIETVSTERAKLGAMQNRLEHTINNLDVTSENMSAANSRIRDTDMAKTMMEYTKTSVLVQSAQAMLAQANQQPQSVLQLLQ
ncbi:MAG: flagellin [Oscillospiraceae bacterium]|nr:flagellin [Oscillospiraceae bacterium]